MKTSILKTSILKTSILKTSILKTSILKNTNNTIYKFICNKAIVLLLILLMNNIVANAGCVNTFAIRVINLTPSIWGNLSGYTAIVFSPGTSLEYEQVDVTTGNFPMLFNNRTHPSIWTLGSNSTQPLLYNYVPALTKPVTLNLTVETGQTGNHQLVSGADYFNFPENVTILLEDLLLNTIVPFQNGQTYNFYAEKSTCIFADRSGKSCISRFKIHIAPPVVCNNSNLKADAGADQIFCPGETITLGGNPAATGGTGNIQYCWIPGNRNRNNSFPAGYGISSINVPNPTARLNRSNSYHLMVTDDNGCVSVDSMFAEMACPAALDLRTDIKKVEAGGSHTLALRKDGTVIAWGDNVYGQLGDGSTIIRLTPVVVLGSDGLTPLTDIIDISASNNNSLALRSDGTVWEWGYAYTNISGHGTLWAQTIPLQNPAFTDVVKISSGANTALALKTDGTLWTWRAMSNETPVQVKGVNGIGYLTNVVDMGRSGHSHGIALLGNGTVYTWGLNSSGQLGNGTFINSSYPVQVLDPTGSAPLSNIVAVDAGYQHCVAVTTNGTVFIWGSNGYGSFGNPGLSGWSHHNLPVQVHNLTDVVSVTASFFVTAVLKSDSSVWTWGWNQKGQIGNGTYTNQLTPYNASNGNKFTQISMSGSMHLIALKEDGTICGLGNNDAGQLGDGTTRAKTIFECSEITDVCLGFQASAGSNVEICMGNETILGSSEFEVGTVYSWSPSSGLSCTDCATPIASPTNSQLYILEKSNAYGCYSTDSVNVTVHPNPYVFAGEDKIVLVNTGNSGPSDPQPCVILDGEVNAGALTYQLSWNPSTYLSNSTILNPTSCPTDTVNYTLIATDANNCSSEDVVTVTYADIATSTLPIVGNNQNLIQICHVDNCTQLTNINKNADCSSPQSLCAHIQHGDYLGPCKCSNKTSANSLNDNSSAEPLNEIQLNNFRVFPNPSSGYVTFYLKSVTDGYATLSISDLYGKQIELILDGNLEQGQEKTIDFNGKHLPAGIYFYQLITSESIENGKITLIK